LSATTCKDKSPDMADMEVDTPVEPKSKKDSREDGKEGKKRFEVKKVGIFRLNGVKATILWQH